MSGTVTATCTFIRVNISGVVGKRDRKVSRFTFYGFYFTVGYQVDVQMPADLDQFR
jgi:hypothetical protein